MRSRSYLLPGVTPQLCNRHWEITPLPSHLGEWMKELTAASHSLSVCKTEGKLGLFI